MKKRVAGFVSVTIGALGCGEPAGPDPLRPQALFARDPSASDSLKGETWKKYLSADALHAAWAPPATSPWRPFYKPTLVAAVSVVRSAAMPIRSPEGTQAEQDAAAAAQRVSLRDSAVFVDLPGEHAVAWGAALARHGLQPVLTVNNWPHQNGILRLERPLGALLYYAEEVARVRAPHEAPPAFLLEGTRLANKTLKPRPEEFDNRFFYATTDFPAADVLKARGIKQIVYVNYRGTTAGSEEEDLNDYFLSLAAAGLPFTYVCPRPGAYEQAIVAPSRRSTIFTPTETARYTGSSPYRRHYYHYHHHYWSRSPGAWGDDSTRYVSPPGGSRSSGSGSRSVWGGGSSG
jgi:hypothetical protein